MLPRGGPKEAAPRTRVLPRRRAQVDNLFAGPIAVSYFATKKLTNAVVVSPDAGGVARAKMFKEGLEAITLSRAIEESHHSVRQRQPLQPW